MFFRPRIESGELRPIWMPIEPLLNTLSQADWNTRHYFSQVNMFLRTFCLSDETLKILYGSSSPYSLVPSTNIREYYYRLFSSKIPNGVPLCKGNLIISDPCRQVKINT